MDWRSGTDLLLSVGEGFMFMLASGASRHSTPETHPPGSTTMESRRRAESAPELQEAKDRDTELW